MTIILSSTVMALPEYANRTHSACATCHVSPGGAGPLTLRGLSWIANGRPDQVPSFENVLLAPGLTDPAALYEVACVPCHGFYGEGLSGSALVGYDLSSSLVRRIIINGVEFYNMPAFEGQFTDEQLTLLASYVSDLSGERITPLQSYPVPEGQLTCVPSQHKLKCGGN
jgi:mono/diheme cytochrome c family protein